MLLKCVLKYWRLIFEKAPDLYWLLSQIIESVVELPIYIHDPVEVMQSDNTTIVQRMCVDKGLESRLK